MPRPLSQRALARRAAPQCRRRPDTVRLRTGVLNASLATLAVSVLGLAVAGSALTPSSAQGADRAHGSAAAANVVTTVNPDATQPGAFQRDEATISRSNFRAALTDDSGDALDATTLTEAAADAAEPATVDAAAVRARAAELVEASAEASKEAKQLAKKKKAKAEAKKKKDGAERKANGVATLPVKSYSIAARFGAVGSWSRYHTGFDFSAPIGSTIYAPTAGVVRTAGSGSASGWAGTYVVVEHDDGNQTLYAHMSSVSVQVGERVAGGTALGQVGVTGRSFGPHLHFEVYPAGVEPGDVYSAVDPRPWLNKLGLTP